MNKLYDKILGCIAGGQVGSALGQPAENMTREELKQEFGVIDRAAGAHPSRHSGQERAPDLS